MRKIIILIGILVAMVGMFIAYSSQGHTQRKAAREHKAKRELSAVFLLLYRA
ncbi:hypothetical protein [Ohtaekwangia sp.]|uniref:hypothetical protein n=1 Tax=Ohtaekwangia sp. TaxID=2066019 RepID=UPI002F936804